MTKRNVKSLLAGTDAVLDLIEASLRKKTPRLDLSGRGLSSIPTAIKELTHLQSLDISRNQFSRLPSAICKLTSLQSLYVSDNRLTKVPVSIGALKQLINLDISRNRLAKLPSAVEKLTQLETLNIAYNELAELPQCIGQLSQLLEFDVSKNRLATLPESIGHLTRLERFYASDNQLVKIPEAMDTLCRLQDLDVANNKIRRLPESIGRLSELRIFDLTNNKLITLPQSLDGLKKLEALYIDHNNLSSLHQSLRRLDSLRKLYLHGNHALGLPEEVLGPPWEEHGAEPASPSGVLEYYFRVHGGQRPLNEAKLILVGRGAVGKTSIVNRLVHKRFKPTEPKTDGINITAWSIQLNGVEDVRLNVWDFGGQEIMHATHQLFLTRRSLYLLVLNGRQGNVDAEAEYWLRLIESFGDDSPVIVILNKITEHPFDVNRRALQQKYPAIRDFIKTDCEDGTGLAQLRKVIERETDRLEHLRDAFPSSWFSIKDKLASMEQNYLSFESYRDLCVQLGEKDPVAQDSLAVYLHSLGVALNYRDDPRLQDTHVLNPHWVTNAIYKILNAPQVEQQKGEIGLDDLATILDHDQYPKEMYRFVFDLMKKFEICFSFPEDGTHYLIPELLDKQETIITAEFSPEACLNFQYHYPVLPEGLLPRFIVRTHVLSEGLERWRTGVILKFGRNRALVKADVQDKKVFISITGPKTGRRHLLGIIRSDFERIHQDVRNLQPLEMVPLPEHPASIVPYQELLLMEENGMRTFPKLVGTKVEELDVYELLNGIDLEDTRDSMTGRREPGVRLFYSYSHKDERLRNELNIHLKLLQRRGLIESWHDRSINTGEVWQGKVNDNLERADIILFLLSADFLASDYCYEKEVLQALERHHNGLARVIPLVVRDVSWSEGPFGHLQALPKDGLPVTSWTNRDSAWRSVAEGLERIIRQRLEGEEQFSDNLFVSSLTLKNIRCFENLKVSFLSGKQINNFILLVGDNGVGKTTLLRSIALGLCDESVATAFLETLPDPLLRRGTNEGLIKIGLSDQRGKHRWNVETILKRNQDGLTIVEQRAPTDLPRDRIFACGYGAGRLRFGTQDYAGYTLKNSLGTLFDYGSSLQNPELAFSRIERSREVSLNELTQRIDAVLMLEPGSTIIDSSGIRIKGPWGDFTPVGSLGDGFQATLGWIADLLGWASSYRLESVLSEVSGIVLIDELEQHLHPSWQREIIKLLHQQFPEIQFITTSHAPMCALGTTALPEPASRIVRLRQLDGHVEAVSLAIPKSQRADQVLTSPLFGLFSASGFDVSADIERYAQLASKKNRSDPEKVEFIELGEHLESVLGPFRTDTDRRIEAAVQTVLHRELENALGSGKLTSKALDFQIRHRIKTLHKDNSIE